MAVSHTDEAVSCIEVAHSRTQLRSRGVQRWMAYSRYIRTLTSRNCGVTESDHTQAWQNDTNIYDQSNGYGSWY